MPSSLRHDPGGQPGQGREEGRPASPENHPGSLRAPQISGVKNIRQIDIISLIGYSILSHTVGLIGNRCDLVKIILS
jgi:hypothetical protein